MQTYVAFLRAINVGGHNVTMEKLRAHFSEMGFTNVRSYIQTGNIFFETRRDDRNKMVAEIEEHLENRLGYAVPTILCTLAELEHSYKMAPFHAMTPGEDTRHLLLFLSEPLDTTFKFPLILPKGDYEVISATPHVAYIVMRLVGGRPGNPLQLEKITGKKATSRFFHTTAKILAALKGS
jgi:uncharacterized protein (DUF1697 family)